MAVGVAVLTPPSLPGIEHRTVNKKHHLGLIRWAVTSGFAGVKFSRSPKKVGRVSSRRNMSLNTGMSFMEKYGWNGILPQFDTIPWGNLTRGGR